MSMTFDEPTWLASAARKADEFRKAYGERVRDEIVSTIYGEAEKLAKSVVSVGKPLRRDWSQTVDAVVTSRMLGYPLMLAMLGLVFWITIAGANYPSEVLARLLFGLEARLASLLTYLDTPAWLRGFLVLGVYRGLAWVVSVMLPPMSIFFPLFALLEDLGYLPRVAFNLDRAFKKVGAHGKQALSMAMGFGCNAAGVVAARIIDSPRERLIAILTNSFVPCNGRFPTLIAMSSMFVGVTAASAGGSLRAAAVVVGMVLIGIVVTLAVSWLLSKTLLSGEPSPFALELPPYRPPQIGQVIVRSFLDRALYVLWRAAVVAAPAGGLTWILANVHVGNTSIIACIASWLDPLGRAIGLDGVILLAFVLGLPANEIVLPIVLMTYLATGSLTELDSLEAMREVFIAHGWTWATALNVMLFSLLHFPCATTLLTIHKETGRARWAILAALIPTTIAFAVCFVTAQGAKLLGLL